MSPEPRLLAFAGAWLALALAAAFEPRLLDAWSAAGIGLALAALGDALALQRAGPLEATRDVRSALSVGVVERVTLSVVNRGGRPVRLRVFDHHPAGFEAKGVPRDAELAAHERASFAYELRALGRGKHRFGKIELVSRSPLGLWRRSILAGADQELRVFPNFRAVSRYELLAAANRSGELGVRRRPRRGEGLEFHQLREYRVGDSLRQIDWKATARLHRAVSREYEEERDQQIVFLLDCGRKMHARDAELSHFDHALDAVLLLAHVALRQGDAVGLSTFSGERRFLAARKGTQQLRRVLNAVYDLESSTRASDYLEAAEALAGALHKRALVVVVSNLRDEDHEELLAAARLLGRRHLVLVASMKERALAKALDAPVRDLDSALTNAATHQYVLARRRAHERLRKAGVLALDAEPHQLAIALVNGYLDVKRSGML
ncbi:MAG TPA: DUF58 domain-containing protein [Myxococcota bacterium]|nr:DUF58 domain-containing protein [Myxococcota bacterium]